MEKRCVREYGGYILRISPHQHQISTFFNGEWQNRASNIYPHSMNLPLSPAPSLITYSKQHFSPLSPFANSSTWIFSPVFNAVSMSLFFAEQSAEYLQIRPSCQKLEFGHVGAYTSARANAIKPVVVATSLRELRSCARGRQKRMRDIEARTTRR